MGAAEIKPYRITLSRSVVTEAAVVVHAEGQADAERIARALEPTLAARDWTEVFNELATHGEEEAK